MKQHTLEIKGLVAAVGGKQILNGIDLTVRSGEVHAIMGPNGAGKTTLSSVVMGRPGYEVLGGQVLLDGEDVLALPAWRRAQAGLHLVMQYPSEVPGVMLADVMGEAFAARGRSTDGLAGVRVARPAGGDRTPFVAHDAEFVFGFVLAGTCTLAVEGRAAETMEEGDTFVVPRGVAHALTGCSADFELLDVTLPEVVVPA